MRIGDLKSQLENESAAMSNYLQSLHFCGGGKSGRQ